MSDGDFSGPEKLIMERNERIAALRTRLERAEASRPLAS